ncbi:MAG: M14 family zinc carboxypeptidase [Bryobacteraceae bacterium]
MTIRFRLLVLAVCVLPVNQAFQTSTPEANHLLDPFAAGWMLRDTNGDGIVDFIAGKVVVPENPTAAENAAAADIAARLGFGSTGLTPPLVIPANDDRKDGPRIYVGRSASVNYQLEANEGGVFEAGDNLLIVGHDDAGLLAAAEAFASRAPYLWKVPGDRLDVLPLEVKAKLIGLTYLKGKASIAVAQFVGSATKEQLAAAIKSPKLANVHELLVGDVSAVSEKPLSPEPPAAPPATAAPAAAPTDAEAGPQRLDLATLYTMHGLFRGTARMPIPSNLDAQLYVPAGKAGIAMANLAARVGLETTGITLPLATPDSGAAIKDVRTKSVIVEGSDLAKEAARKLHEEDQNADSLAPGEGELRVVDKAFGRQSAVLVSGDPAAALGLLSDHFPNLWETGKQYLSLEEIRYDLHRFFSLRSSAGQASVALYRLDKWMEEIVGPVHDVEAKVFVDIAEPGLKESVAKEIAAKLKTSVKVETGSLHAGTQCCEHNPSLHYEAPGFIFHQATPTFQEDLVIPWEGARLLKAVKAALPKLNGPVKILARVSEGPEQRQKLAAQIKAMVPQAQVTVLCAYKQGFSWLMDEIAPQLKGKPVASMKIEFKKNEDATGMRVMYSPARWVHELYPVDEALAAALKIPLEKIQLDQYDGGPTYRVHAYDAAGKELLKREFTVTTVTQPYNGVIKPYEQVQVDTGWVRIESGQTVILDQRIKTDIEEFWDHYQNETLPKIFRYVMSQSHGELRPEFAPIFDTLKIDIHMSEPDFMLGIDKEHISSLEALQEDTFYSTENFANMIGDMEAGRAVTYVGRIIPIVHAPDDGKDGHVHIEFYGKPAANPMVELKWTDAQGKRHERTRNLYALTGAMQPRLIEARATADGPQSLTWLLPADFKEDKYNDWVKLEGTTQIERGVFPAEQAKGQIQWLQAMQAEGLYKDELAYPHLRKMAVEFELPVPLTAKVDSAAPREIGSWNVSRPLANRPMIADFRDPKKNKVQWDEPISPGENASILAKLSEFPGVNAYWMGRSYLGQNLWAADVMLPSPAKLKSWAKETTLKASILYSGRQHANEVSSTSHIDKLGEQLVTDDATRALLKQVNVVLHPITNSDGADLSVQLAEITPDNMLHPGYHGSLAADVAAGQAETDPVYPESRTRKQLLDGWLPDAFLNPHGYPSHEWVQPFSEYSAWVTTRQGANNGRTWWIPRGWFTSLTYLRDDTHLYSEKIAYEIRDRIVEAQRNVPGLLDLENRMNARYQRFGQRWQPEDMQQPIVNGIRIYMALKGSPGRGGAGATGGATGGVSPDITWDSGYTEAPDETAHGDYMKLMASAGLAFDRVHLDYLAHAKLRINRTEREQGGKVTWRIERQRPNLPTSESEPPRPQP